MEKVRYKNKIMASLIVTPANFQHSGNYREIGIFIKKKRIGESRSG